MDDTFDRQDPGFEDNGDNMRGETGPGDVANSNIYTGLTSGGTGTEIGSDVVTKGGANRNFPGGRAGTVGGTPSQEIGTVGQGIPPLRRPGERDEPKREVGPIATGAGIPVGAPSDDVQPPLSEYPQGNTWNSATTDGSGEGNPGTFSSAPPSDDLAESAGTSGTIARETRPVPSAGAKPENGSTGGGAANATGSSTEVQFLGDVNPPELDRGLGVDTSTRDSMPTDMSFHGAQPGGVGDGVDTRDLGDITDLADTNTGNLGLDRQTVWTEAAASDTE